MSERTARQKLASRTVYGTFLGFAAAFIVSSTVQIIVGVFGVGTEPIVPPAPAAGGSAAGLPDREAQACAEGIVRLTAALDRGFGRAARREGPGHDETAVLAAFQAEIEPEWAGQAAVEQSCAGQPRGEDAFAALLRLKWAQEGFVRRQLVEIDPLRRTVQAYLPH